MDLDIEMVDSAADDGLPLFEHMAASVGDPSTTSLDGGESVGPESEGQALVPNKIYIRGVDTLSTSDIKAYVAAHHGPVSRIEWIDDSSANLVFDSDSAARDAVTALSAVPIIDPTQLPPLEFVPARPVDGRAELALQIRFAVVADRKAAGAAARSRYYLLHPDEDPEERRRRERGRYRGDRGDRSDRSDRGDRHDGRGHNRRRRDNDSPPPPSPEFDLSFYDDPKPAPPARRAGPRGRDRPATPSEPDDMMADDDESRRWRPNRNRELFPTSGRGRSASPDRASHHSRHSARLERDPDRDESTMRNKMRSRVVKERFSRGVRGGGRELFPDKLGGSGHTSRLDQLEAVLGSARLETDNDPKPHPNDVAASATARAGGVMGGGGGGGSNWSRPSDFAIKTGDISIKGTAAKIAGISIKGAARATTQPGSRELFPDKVGGGVGSSNRGREVFANKAQDTGRGRSSQHAEHLFSAS